ncbi:UNVERIFIED_ORG: hypothetical protein L601_001100000890 [Gordonia westfalica J30]
MGAQPLERNKVGPPCKLIRSEGCGIVVRAQRSPRIPGGRGWAMFGPIARILSG